MTTLSDEAKRTNTEDTPLELLRMMKNDVVAAAGLVTLGADGVLDRAALVKKLIDPHGAIEMPEHALADR